MKTPALSEAPPRETSAGKPFGFRIFNPKGWGMRRLRNRRSMVEVLVFGIFLLVVAQLAVPSALAASDELYFLHPDHLGSTRAVTDRNGNVVARYDYWPYGSSYEAESGIMAIEQSSVPIERLYTSQIQDKSTDLYFYNSRYYNPALGTFISPDSIQGPNRYAYVANNPINMIDSIGNSPQYFSEFLTVEQAISMMEQEKQRFIVENNFIITQSEINRHILGESMRNLWLQNTEDDTAFFPKYLYSEKVGVIDLEHFFTGVALAEFYDETVGTLDIENIILGTSLTKLELIEAGTTGWESFEWIMGGIQKLLGFKEASEIDYIGSFSYEDIPFDII